MHFHIISLFPMAMDSYFNESVIWRARKDRRLFIHFYNPRDVTKDKHRTVDARPYGGGPGMVIKAEPVLRSFEKALQKIKKREKKGKKARIKKILFTPNGKQFSNAYARNLSRRYTDIILICGHYEGIDERVRKIIRPEEISIGPFIVTGGEIPAEVVVDSVTRHIPGVLGNESSIEESRIVSKDVYTRPESFIWKGKNYKVPEILLSGHHQKIDKWRQDN